MYPRLLATAPAPSTGAAAATLRSVCTGVCLGWGVRRRQTRRGGALRQEIMPESKEAELERGKALMAGDSLITRFCLYGFLKNLKFFEP